MQHFDHLDFLKVVIPHAAYVEVSLSDARKEQLFCALEHAIRIE